MSKRSLRTVRLCVVLTLALSGCDRTEVRPSDPPALGPEQGLLAIVVTTFRPTTTIHFVSADNRSQFNLSTVQPGTSLQVHRVPADSYCVQSVIWPTSTFHADNLGIGRILCLEVEPGVLNYPGHMEFADGESSLARSLFHTRYVPRREDFERRIQAEYPNLVPLLE